MALDFNGTSAYADGGDLTFLDGQEPWSFSVWVNLDVDNADQIIWEKCQASFADGITVFFDDDRGGTTNTFEMFHTSVERLNSSPANQSTTGTWQHICGHVDWNEGSGAQMWVDGTSVGTTTFNSEVTDTNPFQLGRHNDAASRRWLNGQLCYLTFWDSDLTAAEVAALSAGDPVEEAKPDGIIRHWDLADNTSPTPEAINGTDTLTLTDTSAATSKALNVAALTTALEEDITDTTASLSCVSDAAGGEMYCYVSTSASAPSVADLIAGTGAVAHSSATLAPSKFTFTSEVATDVDSTQAVAFDGTYYYTTSGNTSTSNKEIHVYNSSWVEVVSSPFDTSTINGDAHAQCNGIYVDEDTGNIYVTLMNFPTTPELSWIATFTVDGAGALTNTAVDSLSEGGHVEAGALHNGEWWFCFHDVHEIHKYNTSFVHQKTYALPVGTDPGTSRWQSIVWFDGDYIAVNVHGNNTNAPRTDVYEYISSSDSFVTHQTDVLSEMTTHEQGFTKRGSILYWAERVSLTVGDVATGAYEQNPTAAKNKFAITGLSAGTTYYTYFLQDHAVKGTGTSETIDSNILESGSWTTTGSSGGLNGSRATQIGVGVGV